ncbi:hypothetical protein I5I50_27845 [Pseudomonas aeruginosa]|nr:hypothetical protein [Pseudomonas aeruginosa]
MPYRGRLLRAYRTGDRARYDEQGRLRFIGRGDGQVKLNGYRLDLPALEQRFRRQPGILDCALLVRERNGVKQLLCAWTGKADTSPQALLRQLPTWQRPPACVRGEALPLTAHGKLDRAALLHRLEEPLERCASALDPDQRGCAQLWSELLGCEVGAADQDFFLCGGNSLLALQLVALCQSAGAGANLGLADLQANSRLDQFSRLLRSHGLAPERLLERAATPEQPLVLSRSAA